MGSERDIAPISSRTHYWFSFMYDTKYDPFNTSHLKNQHTMSNVTFTIFIKVHFTINSFLFDFNNGFVICLSSQKLQLLSKSLLLFKCEPNRIPYVSIIAPL